MQSIDNFLNFEYLYKAFKKAQNNRSYKQSAMYFRLQAVQNLVQLQQELKNQTYKVGKYTEFTVKEPKERIIQACSFRDKIVQHLLCDNILNQHMSHIYIKDNYAGQRGKGTSFAYRRTIQQLKEFGKKHTEGYIFKGDISKFYYNINHQKSIDQMEYYFDKSLWWLIEVFTNSTKGDIGLPLGNQINTIASNIYLEGLDRFVKYDLGIQYYGRYADDFYFLCEDKNTAIVYSELIVEYLNTLDLQLNPKSQIIPLKNGLPFCGFIFKYNIQSKWVIVKKRNDKRRAYARKFNRMCNLVLCNKMPLSALLASFNSWSSHSKWCTNYKQISKPYLQKINLLKNKVMHKEVKKMIENGNYEISERTSYDSPIPHRDGNVIYIPVNISTSTDDNGKTLYTFNEWRIIKPENLPDECVSDMADIIAKEGTAQKVLTKIEEVYNE